MSEINTKVCATCKVEKPLDEFHRANKTNAKHKRQASCKPCMQKKNEAWRANNPEKYAQQKRNIRFREMGMTQEDYDRMLAAQDGGCAICGTTDPNNGNSERFAIDHDHRCCPPRKACPKCVRGLLCGTCNTGLGGFKDDTSLLLKAIAYLQAHGL